MAEATKEEIEALACIVEGSSFDEATSRLSLPLSTPVGTAAIQLVLPSGYPAVPVSDIDVLGIPESFAADLQEILSRLAADLQGEVVGFRLHEAAQTFLAERQEQLAAALAEERSEQAEGSGAGDEKKKGVKAGKRGKVEPKPTPAANPAPPKVSENPKQKTPFLPAEKVFHRLMWDEQFNPDEYDIGYEDRFKGILYMPLRKFRTGEDETTDVPFHRIRNFRHMGTTIVWDKEKRINLLSEVAEGGITAAVTEGSTEAPSSTPDDAPQAKKRGPKGGNYPYYEPVVSALWHEAIGDWVAESGSDPAPVAKARDLELTALTYNVLFNKFDAEKLHGERRIHLLLAEIERLNPEVVGLQEVTQPLLVALKESPFVRKFYRISDVSDRSITPDGQLILSRLPFRGPCQLFWLTPGKKMLFGKVALPILEGDETERVLTVACVHLISDYAPESKKRRLQEAGKLFQVLTPVGDSLVLGDFNFGDNEPEQREVDWADFEDVWPAVRPGDPGMSFDLTRNTLADITSKRTRTPRRLDRVLIRSPALRPLAAELVGTECVVVPGGGPEGSDFRLFPSDHFGVFTRLRLLSPQLLVPPPRDVPLAHKTALVVIPPRHLHSRINAIRERYDKAYPRWPPHVNLFYPFLPESRFEEFALNVWSCASTVRPFTIQLREFCEFDGHKCYVWLNPEAVGPVKGLHQLHCKLLSAFPMCRKKEAFQPHLTVGQLSKAEVSRIKRDLADAWEPVEFEVNEVHMISRIDEDSPFRIIHSVPLGASASPPDFPSPSPEYGVEEDAAGSGAITADELAERMVLDRVTWGTRKLSPYLPADSLEQWLFEHTVRDLARDAPTHISQLGGMYHIPSEAVDGYLRAWRASLDAAEATPFYVEEVRGDVFRLYVDFDIKLTAFVPFDLVASGWLASVLRFTRRFFGETADCTVVVTECHGKWDDHLDRDATFKSGFRLYFLSIFVDVPVYRAYIARLAETLAAEFPEPYANRPKNATWKHVCDAKSVSWDRARLLGTIKRRRNLQRRYTLLGCYDDSASLCGETDRWLREQQLALLYATTVRIWAAPGADTLGPENMTRRANFDVSKFFNTSRGLSDPHC
eukprot:TRINITY_DN8672_c0_g1_i2.p1 TRINITY_DN8672_c0_g1~~TRINITY_DN8672_c0_g1_i2.p1  ORF type:complete len:1107 (-),score=196.52 TRINITY_DN8672_c0_g1_i2:345-3638(-)